MTHLNENSHPCEPLCQHPSCWGTLGRRRQPQYCSRDDDYFDSDSGSARTLRMLSRRFTDAELPTLKVYDMLSDYGPTKQAASKPRATSSDSNNRRVRRLYQRLSSGIDAPHTTPASTRSPTTAKSSKHPPSGVTRAPTSAGVSTSRERSTMNRLIVHEIVSVREARKRGDEDDHVGIKMVWVPKKKKQRKLTKPTIQQIVSRGPALVPVNDVTQQCLPLDIDADRDFESKRRHVPQLGASPRRHYAGHKNDFSVDLFSLPPELLQAVIEKLQESEDLDQQRILEALMRVVPTFSAQEDASHAIYRSLLKQEKATLYEAELRVPRIPPDTQPAYKLDQAEGAIENNVQDERTVPALEIEEGPARYREEDSIVEAPSLSNYPETDRTLNHKRPLPPIKGTSLTNISLGLPEIPSGMKFTKTFTYNKKQALQDFSLGPVSPVHLEDRSSPRTLGESSVHMACPTESSVLGETADMYRLREVEISLPVREQVRRQKTPRRDLVTNTRTTRYKMDPVPQTTNSGGGNNSGRPAGPHGVGPQGGTGRTGIPRGPSGGRSGGPHGASLPASLPRCPPGSPVSFGLEPIQESMETGSTPVHIPESTVAISEAATPRSRTRQSSRPGTGGLSPDTWPNIREEDYLTSPTPEPPRNTMISDSPLPEVQNGSGSNSPKPAVSSTLDLPAPPPPSPYVEKSSSPDFATYGGEVRESAAERDLYTLEEEDADHRAEHAEPLPETTEREAELAELVPEETTEHVPETTEPVRETTEPGEVNENNNNDEMDEAAGPWSLEDLASNTMNDIMAGMGLGGAETESEDGGGAWGGMFLG